MKSQKTPEVDYISSKFYVRNSSDVSRPSEQFPLTKNVHEVLQKSFGEIKNKEDKYYILLLKAACNGLNETPELQQIQPRKGGLLTTVNKLDSLQGAAPLHYAAMFGHSTVVQFLLKIQAEVDIWDAKYQVTPMMCAAAFGNWEVMKILIKAGADVNAGLENTGHATSPLLWATRIGHTEIVKYLLEEHNASKHPSVMHAEAPIHAAVLGGYTDILEELIKHDASLDLCMGEDKNTPLHLSASGAPKSLETCKILLKYGNPVVDVVNGKGQTPLHVISAFMLIILKIH